MTPEHQRIRYNLKIRNTEPVDENTAHGIEKMQQLDDIDKSKVLTDGDDEVDRAHDHERQPCDQRNHSDDKRCHGEAVVTVVGVLMKTPSQPFDSAQKDGVGCSDDYEEHCQERHPHKEGDHIGVEDIEAHKRYSGDDERAHPHQCYELCDDFLFAAPVFEGQ